MIKEQKQCRKKFLLVYFILLLAGCSAIGKARIAETPSLTPIAANTSTSTPTLASTSLPYVAGKIAFMYASNIYVINADGSDLGNLTNNSLYNSRPAWSPDGQQIAYTSEVHGVSNIYVMRADGSNQVQLTHDTTRAWGPIWSPDGKYILFNSERDGVFTKDRNIPVSEVYMMNSDGSEQKRLTNNRDFERELAWSPEGNVIAVSANLETPYGYDREWLYLMSLDGTISKEPLTLGDIDRPAWSPNGEYIAFASTVLGESKICTIKVDASNLICLLKSVSPVFYLSPSWSPDGSHIIFSSNIDGYGYNLYIMNADGSNLTRLTNMPGDEMSSSWAPSP